MYSLQNILQLHQRGNIKEAESGYVKLLSRNPNDINVNYLFGKLLNDTGRPKQAIAMLKNAHGQMPDNPAITFEYASCLLALHQTELAITVLNKVKHLGVEQAKLYLEALSHKKDNTSLLAAFNSLVTDKNRISLTLKIASIYEQRDELTNSSLYYSEILELDPINVIALHNLSSILRRQSRPEEALLLMKKAQENGLNNYQMHHNFGNIYSDLNMLAEAIESYETALRFNPNYEDTYHNLASIYAECGQPNNSFNIYKNAIDNGIKSEGLIVALLERYVRFNMKNDAVDIVNEWKDVLRESEPFAIARAKLIALYGDLAGAINILRGVESDESKLLQAEYSIRLNRLEEASKDLRYLMTQPNAAVMAKAYLATIQRLKNGSSNLDYQRFVKSYNIDEFYTGKNAANYLSELNRFLRKLHTGTHAPIEQTLNKGTQTRGNLLALTDNPLVAQLRDFFTTSIDDYIQTVSNDALPHDYVVSPDSDFEIVGSWSVLLTNDGYHTNHVHPEGLLSAVFYVDIPDYICEQSIDGHLSFGVPNFALEKELAPEMTVKPISGKLVIFPSFFWHGTVPFKCGQDRLTVAFDISNAKIGKNID